MSWRKILLLGLALAVLGGYLYFYELKHKQAQKVAEEKAKKVFSLEAAAVEEVSLKKGERLISCRKDGEQWRLRAPLQVAADPEAIDNLLFTLTRLDTERVVEKEPRDLSPYGLNEPEFEVTLRGKEGKNAEVSQTLLIGQANPTNSFLYAAVKGDPQVILVELSLRHDLDKDVYDLRDKTVLAFQAEEVRKLELSQDNLRIVCQRSPGGRWTLSSPVQYRANAEKVREILSQAKGLKVKEFIAEEVQDFSLYQLDPPALRVSLWTDPQGEPSQVLWLGAPNEKGLGVYARRRDGANVFTIQADFLKTLPASVDDLRDPHPFDIAEEQKVEKVELRYPEESVLCIKDEGGRWQIQQPVQAAADKTEMAALLEKFRSLKVEKFVEDGPGDLNAFGLSSPQRQFRLWQRGQVDPQVLSVGGKADDDQVLYARMEDQKVIFVLSSAQVEGLSKKAHELRDRALLSFSTDEIGKLAVKHPSKGFTLERKGEEWRVTEPKRAKARYTKVLDLLWEINGLKYREIVTEKGDEKDAYGLEKPLLSLTLWKANGDLLDTLVLGAKVPEKNANFAKTKSGATVYLIDEKFLDKIPQEVAEVVEE